MSDAKFKNQKVFKSRWAYSLFIHTRRDRCRPATSRHGGTIWEIKMNKLYDPQVEQLVRSSEGESAPLLKASSSLMRRLDRIGKSILRQMSLCARKNTTSPSGAKPQARLDGALCDAAQRGDIKKIQKLLGLGANPNAIRRRFRYAMYLGHIGDAHDSALLLALKAKSITGIRVSRCLLDAGANPTYTNRHGESAAQFLPALRQQVIMAFGHHDTPEYLQLEAVILRATYREQQ